MIAKFSHSVDEADNITSFFFIPERPLRFVAGQFIEMTLPHANPDSRGVKRWFTLSSAPGHQQLSITTKHALNPSSFKQALWNLNADDQVSISESMGDFVLPKDETIGLVFIAGGIGITPFHSIVRWLEDTKQTRSIQLIYSSHSQQEIVFSDLFYKPYIQRIEIIDKPKLTAVKIVDLVDGIHGKQVFISGPEPMTESIVEQFKTLGVTQDQLITDYFPGYDKI